MLRELSPGRRGLMAVAALAAASHATALGGGYVWLDHAHLREGRALAAPSGWLGLFTRGFADTSFYRPLMALSLSIDAAVSKTPGFFHAITLGWHALASVMTTVAARALGLSPRAALAAGLLFAVHPTTSLVASAIAFRSEAMIAVFLLALVAAHQAQKPALAAAALFAGALTKETAWLLGPLFVLALSAERRREGGSTADAGAARHAPPRPQATTADAAARLRLLAAEGVAFAAATGLRLLYAPRFRAQHPALPLDESVGTRLAALGKSALALVVPLDQSICDAFRITRTASLSALFGAAVLGGVALLASRRRGVAWLFALSLLPSLQLVPIMRWWSPHYLYVPLAFGAMLLAHAADRHGRRLWALVLVLGVPFTALSLREGRRYASDERLWAPEVSREPACREGQFFLGEVARDARDWEAAASRYERAAAPDADHLSYADELAALQNLGAVRFAQERWADARAAWTSALERSGDDREKRQITHNLAAVALRSGDPAEAARLLEPETSRNDALPESLLIRARALHDLGREDEAVELVKRLQGMAQKRARAR
ncbi:tetratricopeptide repeat protein [Sorangium sp. So ce381]|uniref:tetratricopeptide repeat protein n=1 Tax=Sorangium sp. So ce381 TaxID=3133307 RepID=UPI003F5C6F19